MMAAERDEHTPAVNGCEPSTMHPETVERTVNQVNSATLTPRAMPSYFANPFMTPFMPQQTSMAPVDQNNPDYRVNPLQADSYLLQSLHCQEMMQHYIQSLMAAASRLPQDVDSGTLQEQSDVGMEHGFANKFPNTLPTLVTSMQQQLTMNGSPLIDPTSSITSTEKPKETDNVSEDGGSGLKKEVELESGECYEIGNVATTNGSEVFEGQRNGTEMSLEEKEKIQTEDERTVEERDAGCSKGDESEKIEIEKEEGKNLVESKESKSSSKEENQNNDCQTSVLIKKQMTEIDKEIHRRTLNKNVKKIDEKELAQLLSTSDSNSSYSANAQTGNIEQSALPYIARQPSVGVEPSVLRPTLEQLRNSYGLGQPPQATNPSPLLVPPPYLHEQVQQQFLQNASQCSPSLPATIEQFAHASALPYAQFPAYFPPPQAFYFPNAQQHVSSQLAAAILQQLQQEQALGMYQGTTFPFTRTQSSSPIAQPAMNGHIQGTPTTVANCMSNSIAEQKIPPPPAAPSNVRRKSLPQNVASDLSHEKCTRKNSETDAHHDWPGETWTENGKPIAGNFSAKKGEKNEGEPVWVMRDSYLKRIQREEDRNNEEILEMKKSAEKIPTVQEEVATETESLLSKSEQANEEDTKTKKSAKKEVIVHEPAVLIEGVLFRAKYLGSTQLLCEGRPTKASRMMQAQEAVARVKAPVGEIQPRTDIDLFISTEKIMVLNTDLQDILMDHALRTISYIADIGDLVVLMARRVSQFSDEDSLAERAPRVLCHVFESEEASFIAQSIGQAFQVAYVEFLRANGIDDPSYLREIDYQEVLNSQELLGDELEMFAKKEAQKDVVVPKKAGEPLGIVVVESGWGSMLPTVVIANLQPNGAASRCNQLNIGDQIIAINGISLVGLPLASAQQNIKGARSSTAVRLTVVSTPPVVEVRIKRPDAKYQLGFSVQNGMICSLLRGGIAERGGIRVGHRIIEINSQSVVAVPHEKIVNMLATAVGEIHMKTMPTSMFRLLTGQEVPNYI